MTKEVDMAMEIKVKKIGGSDSTSGLVSPLVCQNSHFAEAGTSTLDHFQEIPFFLDHDYHGCQMSSELFQLSFDTIPVNSSWYLCYFLSLRSSSYSHFSMLWYSDKHLGYSLTVMYLIPFLGSG